MPGSVLKIVVTVTLLVLSAIVGCNGILQYAWIFQQQWPMHVIDDTARGPDGVNLTDVNADGRGDVTACWEEGDITRVYLHPGNLLVRNPWPKATIARVPSPEDAVFWDPDNDGAVDVVSCSEGGGIFVHWAPTNVAQYLNESSWQTDAMSAVPTGQWLTCVAAQIDDTHGIDLICGGKEDKPVIGYLASPRNPRQTDAWTWHTLRPATWIMTLIASDMDGDGDADILYSDRKGTTRGIGWLENTGEAVWQDHAISRTEELTGDCMFVTQADLDRDGMGDVVAAVKPRTIIWYRRLNGRGTEWRSHTIHAPSNAGTMKGIACGDIDRDGRTDIVFTCENADGKHGVMWLSYITSPADAYWTAYPISGLKGEKFDVVRLVDIDNDGDLDVLTCEEREINAVIWYENRYTAASANQSP